MLANITSFMLELPTFLEALTLSDGTLINIDNDLSFPHLLNHDLCKLLPEVEASVCIAELRHMSELSIIEVAFFMQNSP